MKAASLHELKKELQELSPSQLAELCIALAKYKKDNKEYLGYLLFDAHDKSGFIQEVKKEVDGEFAVINSHSNLYHAKKSLRKILRTVNKYCKYLGDKALVAELHIYFCDKMKYCGLPFRRSQILLNLYERELKKIDTLVSALHEDLQNDYLNDLERIAL